MEKIFKSIEYDYNLLNKNIDSLCKRYSFLEKKSIGKSVAGRDVWALKLGKSDDYALYSAAFHGSEHITTNIIMMWLEDICYSIKEKTSLCDLKISKSILQRGIIIIPRINPDGCEISIKGPAGCLGLQKEIYKMCSGDFKHYNANLRGVDINHNFDASWEELKKKEEEMGIHFPCSSRFGGYKKMSEPETNAIVNLCKNTKIRHATAIHSQGQVIYWTYGKSNPPHSKEMARIMSNVSGYALEYTFGITNGGGFKDWFIKEFNRPGFTIEVGIGKNPLPIISASEIYEEVKKMLTISTIF